MAFVRFASVYRQFQDVQDFVDELDGMLAKGTTDAQGERVEGRGCSTGVRNRCAGVLAIPGTGCRDNWMRFVV